MLERPARAEGETARAHWEREKAWQVAVGEVCRRCGAYANILRPPGYRDLCRDCKRLDRDADEVSSGRYIRCPRCRHLADAGDLDGGSRLLDDGTHDFACDECGHEFEVRTSLSISWESPALLPEVPVCDCGAECPGGLSADGWCASCQAERDEERRLEEEEEGGRDA